MCRSVSLSLFCFVFPTFCLSFRHPLHLTPHVSQNRTYQTFFFVRRDHQHCFKIISPTSFSFFSRFIQILNGIFIAVQPALITKPWRKSGCVTVDVRESQSSFSRQQSQTLFVLPSYAMCNLPVTVHSWFGFQKAAVLLAQRK